MFKCINIKLKVVQFQKHNFIMVNFLTKEERMSIVALSKAGKNWPEVILLMKREFGCHVSKRGCQKIVQKFNSRGNVDDAPRNGRPIQFSIRDKRLIKRLAIRSRLSSLSEVALEFYRQTGRKISYIWVRKVLNDFGLRRYVAIPKPFLNFKQRLRRKEWASMRISCPVRNGWDSILFSDEKIFKMNSDRRKQYVTRTKSESHKQCCILPNVKHGIQVHVWGIISINGVGPLRRVNGILNSEKYKNEIIHDISIVAPALIFPKRNFKFMQDNSPVHTSKSTTQFLHHNNIPMCIWPGNSPDANIIENLWSYMSWKLKNVLVHNANEYWKEIQEVWYNIPTVYIRGLYESLPDRMTAIVKARGGATRF